MYELHWNRKLAGNPVITDTLKVFPVISGFVSGWNYLIFLITFPDHKCLEFQYVIVNLTNQRDSTWNPCTSKRAGNVTGAHLHPGDHWTRPAFAESLGSECAISKSPGFFSKKQTVAPLPSQLHSWSSADLDGAGGGNRQKEHRGFGVDEGSSGLWSKRHYHYPKEDILWCLFFYHKPHPNNSLRNCSNRYPQAAATLCSYLRGFFVTAAGTKLKEMLVELLWCK